MESQQKVLATRLESEQDFHNERYGSGEDTRGHLNKFYVAISAGDQEYSNIVRKLSLNKTILEYGCADGTFALSEMHTPDIAKEYNGIDISDKAIALAEKKAQAAGYQNCNFVAMNAEKMTFADESFDLIHGHGILHHLDLNLCFAELYRTLKPGGSAVFMEPLGHNFLLNWYRARTPGLRTPDEHPLLAEDLVLAGKFFPTVDVKFSGLTTILAFPFQKTRFAKMTLNLFINLDKLLFRSRFLGLQAWYTLLVLTKAPNAAK